MSANPITGDEMRSKMLSGESKRMFDENFDRIFRKPSEDDWDDEQESRIKERVNE